MDHADAGRLQDPEDQVRFEELLLELSTRFIDLAPGAVDREIEDALRRVCELLGIDVAVLWQWSASAPDIVAPTHGYPGRQGQFDALAQEAYPWVIERMRAGRMVALSRLEDLPAEAGTDRESARRTGIRSNLTLPLSVGGAPPLGALAFNTLRVERGWPDPLVKRLQLIAQVFTHALSRKRADESLRESEARSAAAADLAGLGFYELDYGGGASYFDDRFRELCGVPAGLEEGLETFEFWSEHLHPDDRASIMDARRQLHDGLVERICLEYRFSHPVAGRAVVAAPRPGRLTRRPRGTVKTHGRAARHHGDASRPRRRCGSRSRRSNG